MTFTLPFVIGHRGAALWAPENTLSGFRAAAETGATWVEVDVQLTRDGVAVLLHDDRLDRTTNGTGLLADTSFSALMQLDAGSWFHPRFAGEPVPTLKDAIATASALGLGLNIELKVAHAGAAKDLVHATVRVLEEHWPDPSCPPLLSSFNEDALAEARVMAPGLPRGLLVTGANGDWQAAAARVAATTLNMNEQSLTTDVLAAAAKRSLPVVAYTVNDAGRARHLKEEGVLAVITDDPSLMRDIGP